MDVFKTVGARLSARVIATLLFLDVAACGVAFAEGQRSDVAFSPEELVEPGLP